MVTLSVALLAITLLPVLNVLPIGLVVGERCLYLPSVGLCARRGRLRGLKRRASESPPPRLRARDNRGAAVREGGIALAHALRH
jgi:hypothetical protein